MRLGVRGHDVIHHNIEELVEKTNEKDLKSIHLALQKVKTGFHITDGSMTPGMAKYLKSIFNKFNIDVSILGCYINLANPDDGELNELLKKFKEHIRFARDLGCSIVGTETGALNKEYVYTPENNSEEAFQRTLSSIKVIIEEAEKFGVIVAIEGVSEHVINTPERMKRVLDNINSNNLQVIFDPVNLINEENYKDQDYLIKRSFELFGDRIVAIHVKDFIYEDGEIKLASIGQGNLNYKLLLSLIKERKPYIDIIMENTTEEDLDESIKYITEIYNKL